MVSTLDSTGLTIEPKTQIIADLVAALHVIYGSDINVDSNSPDGQLINIFAQADTDLLELLLDAYNSMIVPTSYGTRLDEVVALNGIARKQGTYTQAQVLVTATQALTLPGLDQLTLTPFTVADNAGNQFQLVSSYTFGGAASVVLTFQAVTIGQVETTANTITNIITSTLGISTVNNPSVNISTTGNTSVGFPQITNIPSTAGMFPGLIVSGIGIAPNSYILSVDSSTQITITINATANGSGVTIVVANLPDSIGVNEETDAQLKIRHDQSFSLASTGPSDAMESALKNIADVQDAIVVENNTGSSAGGINAHTVWPIVLGGTDEEIGTAIYSKKSPGCGLKGSLSYIVTRPNGQTFTANWDVAISQPLYIAFSIIWVGAPALADADIKTALAAALSFKLGQNPSIGDLVRAMFAIAPTAIVTINSSTQGVSDDGSSWESQVAPTTAQNYYSVTTGNITIS